MPTKPIDAIDITLDPASSVPLNEQLYRAVRERIGKRLFAGDKLPASRDLARLLGVGRVTVTTAYGRLQAEGFLEAKPGVGTVVAERMSVNRAEDWSEPQAGEDAEAPKSAVRSPALGRSAAAAVEAARFHVQALEPLAVINPDFDSLPGRKWTQIVARVSKSPWQHNGYCLPGGFPAFRKTIADYVRQTRGILCEPEEVIITTGIQQGLALCGKVLFNEGDRVAVEDPGFEPHRNALRFLGLETVPTPLDENGLSVTALQETDGLRAALVTPSHQYPMGTLMPPDPWARSCRPIEDGRSWPGPDKPAPGSLKTIMTASCGTAALPIPRSPRSTAPTACRAASSISEALRR